MAALPIDAAKIVPQEGQFSKTAALLNRIFEELKRLLKGDAQSFQTEWNRCFPVNKRQSLLKLLQENPAAEFVLDCCWHDINGLLAVFALGQREWQQKEQGKIRRHLAPAYCAFKSYDENKDPAAFLMRQRVKVGVLQEQYTGVTIERGTERIINGPAGAVMSIFTTFPSNAAKVSRGAPHMLEISLRTRGDDTEAVIFDDLPAFNQGQLAGLFDGGLESTGGWGTGLQRLANLLILMWKAADQDGSPIESYHLIDEEWYQKVPGSAPLKIDAAVVNAICPQRPANTTKFFIVRFHHVTGEK